MVRGLEGQKLRKSEDEKIGRKEDGEEKEYTSF